jgi:hypothetical protein
MPQLFLRQIVKVDLPHTVPFWAAQGTRLYAAGTRQSRVKRKHQVPMGLARCFPEGKEASINLGKTSITPALR